MLHIIRQTYPNEVFNACLAQLGSNDYLVLIEDAVLAWAHQDPQIQALHQQCRVFVLQADVEARAIKTPTDMQIDYMGLVKLTESHHPCVTW